MKNLGKSYQNPPLAHILEELLCMWVHGAMQNNILVMMKSF